MPDGPSTEAGKNFSAEAPERSARKASVGENTPGIVTMPLLTAIASTSVSTLGTDHQAPANIRHTGAVGRGEHGTGADQGSFPEALAQPLDRDERLGRIQRHLDHLEATLDQCFNNRLCLVRLDATQDRHKGTSDIGPTNRLYRRHCNCAPQICLAALLNPARGQFGIDRRHTESGCCERGRVEPAQPAVADQAHRLLAAMLRHHIGDFRTDEQAGKPLRAVRALLKTKQLRGPQLEQRRRQMARPGLSRLQAFPERNTVAQRARVPFNGMLQDAVL